MSPRQKKLERKVCLLIGKLSRLGIETEQFIGVVSQLLEVLREIGDQPSHSKFYLEEKERIVLKVERSHGLGRQRRPATDEPCRLT